MKTTPEPMLTAALLIFAYAVVISLTDNFVPLISAEVGVWQFHLTRSLMVVAVLLVLTPFLGLKLRPKRWRNVVARSAFLGGAIMIYFGALGFLPVATAAAGLFTAPIFVLLISRFVYGRRFGLVRMIAVAGGFAGVAMVLGPEAASGASVAALCPIVAGFLYAISIVATREWCEGESTEVLTMGFFISLAVFGLLGLGLLALFPMAGPDGSTTFVTRGWVWPSGRFLFWAFVQAFGALIAMALATRAYQMADASRLSVFEYMTLATAAFWGWVIWGQQQTLLAFAGMILIASAGILIAVRSRDD
jgi:drug/metabolite transporter (DMT)-like permease